MRALELAGLVRAEQGVERACALIEGLLARQAAAGPRIPWPDPVTFRVTGPGFGDVWKSLQYAHYCQRKYGIRARLYTGWHGRPEETVTKEPMCNRFELAQEIAGLLDTAATVELLAQLPLGDAAPVVHWPECHAWHFDQVPARVRWRNPTGRPGRFAYQLDGVSLPGRKNPPAADIPRLFSFAPEGEFVRLGKHLSVRECMEAAAGCDLFFGVDSGMAHLCYGVGVPVFLIEYRSCPGVIFSWHGDKPAIRCADTDDFLCKVAGS